MIGPFFESAGRSVSRQATFRQMVGVHLLVVGVAVLAMSLGIVRNPVHLFGFTLLIAGVVEGALMIGWRLTQWPKSKALELLMISPLTPRWAMIGEQMVGLTLLLFVVLSATPMLAFAVNRGWLTRTEAIALASLAVTWGCVTGFGLVWWAYEPKSVRKLGEKIMLIGVIGYLIVGGLMAENTFGLMQKYLPLSVSDSIWWSFRMFHEDTPFAMVYRLGLNRDPNLWKPWLGLEILGIALIIGFNFRAAFRLRGHYLDRHYSPFVDESGGNRGTIGEHPLAWHAVRRVSEYAGRINLWLAMGASVLYAVYLIAGDRWPTWMGRGVFQAFETLGGPAGLATVLVLLAGVPAAYQYGLWDSSIPERCKKLELLLLTNLKVRDYFWASFKASWHRGRGYLLAAGILIGAAWWAGRCTTAGTIAGIISAFILLTLYGAVGFRFLAQSTGGTAVGFLLSLGLPLMNWTLGSFGRKDLAAVLPPGLLYFSLNDGGFTPQMAFAAAATLAMAGFLTLRSLQNFDKELRAWYGTNLGKR